MQKFTFDYLLDTVLKEGTTQNVVYSIEAQKLSKSFIHLDKVIDYTVIILFPISPF